MIYSGILINCGGPGDDGFDGGSTVYRGNIPIKGTDRPHLFRSERYGPMSYHVEVPAGAYDVYLGFAETYKGIGRKGQRSFYVSVNGSKPVLVDPYGDAGQRNKATVKAFMGIAAKGDDIFDLDAGISIYFVGRTPLINYIEVVRAGALGPSSRV